MKYHIICFLLLLISLCSNAQIRLIDGADGSPVQAASVFINGGKCVGVSDSNGTLPLPKGYTGTVTVQHLNYTGKEFRADTVSNNTVRLTPYTYTIPEVTAKYERPDYMVITAYQRSYMILDSVPSLRLLHTAASRTDKTEDAVGKKLAQVSLEGKRQIGILYQSDDDEIEEA